MNGKIGRRLARVLARRSAKLGTKSAVVTFTFDDAYAQACALGAELVESRGGRATYYVCGNLDSARSGDSKYHNSSDLRRLHARGHEIACHGYSHLNYQKARATEIEADLDANARYFESIGLPAPRNFAFPFGCVSPGAKAVSMDRFRSLRGVQSAINRTKVDLALLKSVPLYSSEISAPVIQSLVEKTRNVGGWLIFFGHDVTTGPSYFDMAPALLSCALDEAVRWQLPILTVNAALDYYSL